MSEQNKATVRRLIEDHWNAKNHALVSEFFAPSVSIHTPDGDLKGLDGASTLLQAYATAFPDFRLIIDDLVAEADKVAFRWTFEGTHRGPFGDIRATGKRVSIPNAIGICRLASGKITESHMCWPKYVLLQELGVLPRG
jgi:predicted ester cyclase